MSKSRKPGDWKTLASGRAKMERELHRGCGLSNIPNVMDSGSAAYRRLQDKLKGKGKRG